MSQLETLPFAGLLAGMGAIGGLSGVMMFSGDLYLAMFMMVVCTVGGYFGGVNTLRKYGLPKNASMAEFMKRAG